jgi:hypothetical protein
MSHCLFVRSVIFSFRYFFKRYCLAEAVPAPRVAEFIHTHRLYRILPLKRSEDSLPPEPSFFELNAKGLTKNRVNLVQAPVDVLVDLLAIPEDCT